MRRLLAAVATACLFMAVCAAPASSGVALRNASLTSNSTKSSVQKDKPTWSPGICHMTINLKETCYFDAADPLSTYFEARVHFDISDDNEAPLMDIHGPGIGGDYPANKIVKAYIQGESAGEWFELEWQWFETTNRDYIQFTPFGYDTIQEGDADWCDVRAWDHSSEGTWSTWRRDCEMNKPQKLRVSVFSSITHQPPLV